MTTNIQGVKIGNTVNFSINNKLHKKVCSTAEEAKELFKAIMIAKENPSEENVKTLRILLNEKRRAAYLVNSLVNFETDLDTGEVFLAGFNTAIPQELLGVIIEYHDNNYPMDAIVNFWKLLMINPDKRVRTSLFNFISKHDFVLTTKGYMLVYKAVYTKTQPKPKKTASDEFTDAITALYNKIKVGWKCAPKNYVVYRTTDGELKVTELKTAQKLEWQMADPYAEILGNLGEMYTALIVAENNDAENIDPVVDYTDMHTQTMTIRVGETVVMDRKDCNSDPSIDCSYGLHVGATKYVETFGGFGNCTILACLVNPANVVAVPNYDHSKMRVSEYFPIATAKYENGHIEIIEQAYFEDDYVNYEIDELENQILMVKNNELPLGTAKNAENENRPMSELLKMIEGRLFDLE